MKARLRPPSVLLYGLLTHLVMPGSLAQEQQPVQAPAEHSAYAQDVRGTVLRSGSGLCWRTGTWTEADALPGCDGALAPPVAKITAPDIVAAPAPAPAAAPSPCSLQLSLSGELGFDFDRAALSAVARRHIDQEFLDRLGQCSLRAITVTGHTDRLGSARYNQLLSEKRAQAVAAYLREKGISAPIRTIGAEASQPVQACRAGLARSALLACLRPNRRVTLEAQGVRE